MFDKDKWQEIWMTITRNKMRSFLTAFGVFWGIFMLVVMSGSGHGLENGVMAGIKDFAKNSCFFYSNNTDEAYKGFKKGRSWTMHTSDLEIIKSRIPGLEYYSAMLMEWKRDKNTIRGERSGSFYIKGFSPDYIHIEPQQLIYGRYINEMDIKDKRKVCVIGKRVYDEMFFGENPLGKMLQVDGIIYKVIGVNNPVSKIQIGGPSEESITLPFSTMQQSYQRGDRIDMIAVTGDENISISSIEEKIKDLIKNNNSISPTDIQAVGSMNAEKEFKMVYNLFTGINWLIWIVGAGTLLAGVVGVSNIMLVSVRERTREIGIRRALGAKPSSILIQILSESVLLTALAGFIGLCAGVGLLQLVSNVLDANMSGDNVFFTSPQIPFSTAVIATLVLLVFGSLAGMLPAWRALQIKAIDAIREE
ncbi:ABC transporter permease [Coprobacter tertius]|uniref:ABC transporter permease n=1 Tax=Coprobacter tertius TaxID=2944915 RepID=A0ABT1MJE8_9BACT|nr:ABC transporter permease [Coprobacter tertius]MCP9612753.1 ABC transporter permease [Coprobacter tertius]